MNIKMKLNQSGFGLAGIVIIILAVAVVVLGGWRVWDAVHSSKPTVKNNQQPEQTGVSVVTNPNNGTSDLVSFLQADDGRCGKLGTSEFKIVQELPGRFAKLGYGCGNTNSPMFARFWQGNWQLISPTDQFMPDGTPSCEMVYKYSISNKLAPKCAALGQSQYQDNPFN